MNKSPIARPRRKSPPELSHWDYEGIVILRSPSRKSFEELLTENQILTEEKLRELSTRVIKEKKNLEQILLETGFNEEKLALVKAEYLGYEFVDLSSYPEPPLKLLKQMKPAYAKNYKVLPLMHKDDTLTIAMVDPRDFMALDEVVRLYSKLLQLHKIILWSCEAIFYFFDNVKYISDYCFVPPETLSIKFLPNTRKN